MSALGIAPFLKQWGTYSNHPRMAEDGKTLETAKQPQGLVA
jgi:hypothetical protein